MSDYICPYEIEALFAKDAPKARTLALDWAGSLDLEYGERAWLPEIGWVEKTDSRKDN